MIPFARLGVVAASKPAAPGGLETYAAILNSDSSPYVQAYNWTGTGWGSKYSDPGTAASQKDIHVGAGKTQEYVNLSYNVWQFSTSGFGTKYTNATGAVFSQNYGGADWTPNDDALALGDYFSSRIQIWQFDSVSGFGTSYTVAENLGDGCAFTTGGNVIGSSGGQAGTPGIAVYPWTGSSIGTKYADPATYSGTTVDIAWSPSTTAVAMPGYNGDKIHAYPWNDSTGFGTKYSSPSVLPSDANNTQGVTFNRTGDAVFYTSFGSSTAGIWAYEWNDSTGFGTKYTSPASLAGDGWLSRIKVTRDNETVIVFQGPDGYDVGSGQALLAWPFDTTTGFGTKYTDPTTAPSLPAYVNQYRTSLAIN